MTESLPDSDRGHDEQVEEAIPMEARPGFVNFGLEALDEVDLSEEFHKRPHTMRSVPFTMRGAYRCAVQVTLNAIVEGRHRRNVVQEERGWKLFFLIPKLLLFRPAGGIVPRDKLEGKLRVVVFVGRMQKLGKNCERGICQEEKKRIAQRRSQSGACRTVSIFGRVVRSKARP